MYERNKAKWGGIMSRALFLVMLLSSTPALANFVRICDKDGNCFTFENVPPCKEWGLAGGSTCSDYEKPQLVVGFHSYDDGRLSVVLHQGRIAGLIRDARGNLNRSVTLLDLPGSQDGNPTGIATRMEISTYSPQQGVFLVVNVIKLDRLTGEVLGLRTWRSNITAPASIAPMDVSDPAPIPFCGPGLYPPKCYPCLGCEKCPDDSGDFCDITGAALTAKNFGTKTLPLAWALEEGKLTRRAWGGFIFVPCGRL